MSKLKLWVCLAFSFLLVSCAIATRQMYSGPQQPNSKVSILQEGEFLQIVAIDNESVPQKYPGLDIFSFSLLPGEHTVTVILDEMRGEYIGVNGFHYTYRERQYRNIQKTLTHTFQAGKKYTVIVKEEEKDWIPEIIED
jgi:hypothetical protein